MLNLLDADRRQLDDGLRRSAQLHRVQHLGPVLLDGTLGKNVQDFRTYLSPWSGHPTTTPSLAVQSGAGKLTVAASWNGASEVASWQVLGGTSATSLTPVATAPRRGFQTGIPLASSSADSPFRRSTRRCGNRRSPTVKA